MSCIYRVFTSIFFIFFIPFVGIAQNIGINDNGAAPNSNAMLDVDVSTDDKGILIPRLTTAQRTSMALGAADEGLTVYDEDTDAYWLWDGSQWVVFSMGDDDWSLTGNGGTNPPNDFIGTLDAEDFVVKTDNTERMRVLSTGELGVNVTNPSSQISVNGSGNGDWAIYAEGASSNSGASAIRASQDAASGFGWSYGVLGNITSYGSGYHAGVRGSVVRGSATTSGRSYGVYATAGNLDVNFGLYSHIQGTQEGAAVFGWDKVGGYGDPIPSIASSGNSWAGFFQGDVNVSEKIFTDNFQMSNGATNGYILQSDANGNASWVDQASISDGKNYWADNGNYLSPGNDWGAANPNVYVYQASEVTGIRVDENPGGTGAGNYAILGDNTYESAFGELGSGRQNGVGVYGQADGGNESGVYGYNSGSGYGVLGNVDNNTGFGVYGDNDNANGTGVMGVGNGLVGGSYLTDGSGVSGTSDNVGVAGFGDGGGASGVYGTSDVNNHYGYVGLPNSGVQGTNSNGPYGILGTDNVGVYGYSDNAGAVGVHGLAEPNSENAAGGFFEGYGNGAGYYAYVADDWNNRKIIGNGTVSEIVPTKEHGRITLTAPESPEYWYQDYYTVEMKDGKAHVSIDPILADIIVVNDKNPIRAFATPVNMPYFNGVTIANQTQKGFDLIELNGGKHSGKLHVQVIVKPKTNYGEGRFPQAKGPAWLKEEVPEARTKNRPSRDEVFEWPADWKVYGYDPEKMKQNSFPQPQERKKKKEATEVNDDEEEKRER